MWTWMRTHVWRAELRAPGLEVGASTPALTLSHLPRVLANICSLPAPGVLPF